MLRHRSVVSCAGHTHSPAAARSARNHFQRTQCAPSALCAGKTAVLAHTCTHRLKDDSEWGEFAHLPGQRFTDFSAMRTEIETDTARLTGPGKGISNVAINLKIHSPAVVNLTLVDLPG